MDGFFEVKENRLLLKTICESWLRTPYRHHCGVKGLGCDCAHFIARVLEEIGLLKWRKNLIPYYPRDWHLHIASELFTETLERRFLKQNIRFERLETKDFVYGDIVLFKYGRAISHGAFFIDGYFYHALNLAGVIKTGLSDKDMVKRFRLLYRILL